ncbi:hypothetical protein SASPL_110077 [Salvia splendens]|uniref:Charged multivesicular body protein 1 n=1 Tax=Salvia splendens TaxID=180675 RepID=A0A8X8Y457_SALSN|nr:hypothetical protein SASPL_110077 [Salvia splendens]
MNYLRLCCNLFLQLKKNRRWSPYLYSSDLPLLPPRHAGEDDLHQQVHGKHRRAKMTSISKSMGSIVKSLESTLPTGNLQKMSETMDQFERQFVNMEVQAEFMESSMAGSTSLSTPEGDVNSLMQQVADDYGLEVSVGLPQPAAHAVTVKNSEKVDEDDLTRRLAELKARG